MASRLSSGQPSSGSDLSLQALAAVFIGNASGGSVINTLAGALIMGLISNGLNLMQVNASWQKVALGIIIVGAVSMDILRNSRMGKRAASERGYKEMPNLGQYLEVSPEVSKALAEKRPVVALESTIISHRMPYPKMLRQHWL